MNRLAIKIDLSKVGPIIKGERSNRLFLEVTDARFFKGANGAVYLDCIAFEQEGNRFGQSHVIKENLSAEERRAGKKAAIYGNIKTFGDSPRRETPSSEAPQTGAEPSPTTEENFNF